METIKKSGEESTCLGLLVLIVSLKYILNDILNGILREEYFIYLDTFLKLFDEIWMMKREWEYATYSFINQYLEENRVTFRTNELRYRSFIQRYIIPREKTDFILESEIKEYMRS